MPPVPQRRALQNNPVVLGGPTEHQGEDEDSLHYALAGGGNSEGPLNGSEHLVRRAKAETARVANGKDLSVRGVGHDRGLEIS